MFYESRQDWFDLIAMYKNQMSCVNITKEVQWEGIEQCVIFGQLNIIFWASGIFQCDQVVLHEDSNMAWSIDNFITDVVEPWKHGFLILILHSVVNVCFPEEGSELW